MVNLTVEPSRLVNVGDLVELICNVHKENVNMAERMSELEDQLLIVLERINDMEKRHAPTNRR